MFFNNRTLRPEEGDLLKAAVSFVSYLDDGGTYVKGWGRCRLHNSHKHHDCFPLHISSRIVKIEVDGPDYNCGDGTSNDGRNGGNVIVFQPQKPS